MRKRKQTVLVDARRFLENFGVDEVILIARRKRRIDDSDHLRRVFADEVSDVGDVESLLEHVVDALEVHDVQIKLLEPRVVTVELVPEPRVEAWNALVGLFDEEMQQRVVDTFGEESVEAIRFSISPRVPSLQYSPAISLD